jgi:hypothetical protein
MRRILVIAGLGYLCIAFIIGIHGVVTQPKGSDDGDSISLELIDRAIRWPVRIFH